MAKINLDAYKFIDLTKTDFSLMTDEELEVYVKDTVTVLEAYKKKMTKANFIFGLAAGILAVRGGQLTKVTLISTKYKKGEASKSELKLIKRVIKTYKKYLVFKIIINLVSNNAGGIDLIAPHVAKRK